MDRWHGLTLQDIREIEDKTREELDRVNFYPSKFVYFTPLLIYHFYYSNEMKELLEE